MRITTLGIDLAKSVFQLHGVNEAGEVVLRRQLRRAALLAFLSELPACRIGMEACASAHDWGRRISAMGHDVRLIAPAYVKPYVKRQKNVRRMQKRSARRYCARAWAMFRSRARNSRAA